MTAALFARILAHDSADEARLPPLVVIYLEKREALLRYFTARLGSAGAAEDLVQDIYLKLDSLDADTPVQNPAAFLYRLGSNLMLDRLRQQRRSAARDGDWRHARVEVIEGEEVADERPADEALVARQRLRLMLEALESLPEPMRRAFRLHKLEGLNQVDTAAALGVSRSSVEKYIAGALRRLSERLEE